MIYIFYGNDLTQINKKIKKIIGNNDFIVENGSADLKNILLKYSPNSNLFGKKNIIIAENVISNSILFNKKELEVLSNSETIYIFKEEKLTANNIKTIEKFSIVEKFEIKKIEKNEFNVFSIANAYEKRNKIESWTLYRKAVETGVSPEAIIGALFWKIKNLYTTNSFYFKKNELIEISSNLVYIYHKGHEGGLDMIVGIEQFILDSLSKK